MALKSGTCSLLFKEKKKSTWVNPCQSGKVKFKLQLMIRLTSLTMAAACLPGAEPLQVEMVALVSSHGHHSWQLRRGKGRRNDLQLQVSDVN